MGFVDRRVRGFNLRMTGHSEAGGVYLVTLIVRGSILDVRI